MSSKPFDWRKWMFDRLKARPGREDILDIVGYNRPGLSGVAKALDKKSVKDVDWGAIRLFHLKKMAIDEYDRPAVSKAYYRLRAKAFAPRTNDETPKGAPKPKKVTLEHEFLELVEQVAAKSTYPDGMRVMIKMCYYMGIVPHLLDRVRVTDVFKVNDDWLVYADKRLTAVPEHMVDEFRAWLQRKKNDIPNPTRQPPRLFLTTMTPLLRPHKYLADTLILIKKFRA